MYRHITVSCCLLAASLVFAQPPGAPRPSPETSFRFGDANRDGFLSREEFGRLVANAPRLRGKPEVVEQLFNRYASNRAKGLTLQEFKQLSALGQPATPAAPEKPSTSSKPASADKPTQEQLAFFEKKIRPVLVEQCYSCHASDAKKIRGGLLLDTRQAIRKGGDTGPAVVPGNPRSSLLLKALHHGDDLKMPPKQKLSEQVIADFERWIAMGAPDPREGEKTVARPEIDLEQARQFWSFQQPKQSTPPQVKQADWPRADLDRYLLAAQEAKGLRPVADADKATLLRRVYLDLIGLPPTPAQLDAFVKDTSPEALAKVVDELLQSPHFGERWGRHWLDVVRYGETSGKDVNLNYPHAWRYRDYVIQSFNADKPYDRFVREQIAGDLLPAKDERQKAEQIVATGFLALGPKSHNMRDRLQFQMDLVDEQIDASTQAFLGLTVACARCHDHKFDPIPQKDYYALAGIFRSTETLYGTVRVIQNAHPSTLIPLSRESGQPSATEKLSRAGVEQLEKQLDDLRKQRAEMFRKGEGFASPMAIFLNIRISTLEGKLGEYEKDGTPRLLAMGVRERFRASDSPLYARGETSKPGDIVPRGFVQVLEENPVKINRGSGRLELANWLASKNNPLTARVMVNRVWLHLFGRGLVPTPDNFGAAGLPPSHPELLDHLALEFMSNGWSVKKLIKQIVLSRSYQLASAHEAGNAEKDADNVLVWRMNKRRLDAEVLRDSMLAVSGLLEREPPLGTPISRAGEGLTQGVQRFGGAFDARSNARSVYLPVIRNGALDSLSLFDVADSSIVVAERVTTSVPAQGLYLLNNPFVIRQAEVAADRLLADKLSDDEAIRQAWRRILNREPSSEETRTARTFLTEFAGAPATAPGPGAGRFGPRFGPRPNPKREALAALCQGLFATADFLYRN